MGRLPAKMPGREKLAEMALAYNSYARAWRTSLAAFAIGIVAHLCYFLTFFCAAKAFESASPHVPTFYDLCSIMPIVNTITAMPVSFGGVGLREKLIESFLESDAHSECSSHVSSRSAVTSSRFCGGWLAGCSTFSTGRASM